MSELDSVADRLLECFRSAFPDVDDETLKNADRDAIPAWDSKMTLTLAMLVEEEFNVWIGEDALEKINSFSQFRDAIKAKL